MSEEQESLLKFPCEFAVKAMGKASDDFDALVYEVIARHVEGLAEGSVNSRPSKNGNYQSVTVTFRAESRAQLDAIYQDLKGCERILMAL